MSFFMQPQQPTNDPMGDLKQLETYKTQDKLFSEIAETAISQDVFDQLRSKLEELNMTADRRLFGDAIQNDMQELYMSTIDENKITLSWLKAHAVHPDEEIKVTETSITSPMVCGNLYGRVSGEPIIRDDGTTVEIELAVDGKWPVAIIGGDNIDRGSLFHLAAFAILIPELDIARNLLCHAAFLGSGTAIATIGSLSVQQGEEGRDSAMYWYAKFVELLGRHGSMLVLANILMEYGRTPEVFLAENFLVIVGRTHDPHAIFALGHLQLAKTDGFVRNPTLAAKYFAFGANDLKDPACMQTLAILHLMKIGVHPDGKIAGRLLRESGSTEDEIEALIKRYESDLFIPPSSPGVLDYVLAGVVGVGALVIGRVMWKRFHGR